MRNTTNRKSVGSCIVLGCLLGAQQGLASKVDLANDTWSFDFAQDSCSISISRNGDGKYKQPVTMFESDSSLVFTGIGTIDEDPAQIMLGGNMQRYPQAETRSLPMINCSRATTTSEDVVQIVGNLQTSDQETVDFTLDFDLSH